MRYSYNWMKFNSYSSEEISYIFNSLCESYDLIEYKSAIYTDDESDEVIKETYYIIPKISNIPEIFNFKIDGNTIKYYAKNNSFKKEFASIIEAILIKYSEGYWN